jgi:hypothetical protein
MMRRNRPGWLALILLVATGLVGAFLVAQPGADARPVARKATLSRPVAPYTTAPEPGCSLRACIAGQARYELSNEDHHKYEHPAGSNCNFFSTKWHTSDAPKCSNGMFAESWCMDFVHWVYKHEGASVKGLGSLPHLAAAAKVYGQNHGTWHPNVPHVGDMALWNTNHHVEIVISVNRKTKHITTISGNWSDQISKKTEPWSDYLGFASPVAR